MGVMATSIILTISRFYWFLRTRFRIPSTPNKRTKTTTENHPSGSLGSSSQPCHSWPRQMDAHYRGMGQWRNGGPTSPLARRSLPVQVPSRHRRHNNPDRNRYHRGDLPCGMDDSNHSRQSLLSRTACR